MNHITPDSEARRESARQADGKFGTQEYDEAVGGLSALEGPSERDLRDSIVRWGRVTVTEGSRTPWGTADFVFHPVAGIAHVGTPGHGGVKLSPERNREIPAPLRNRSGWYEEDCEAYIVSMVFPEAFMGEWPKNQWWQHEDRIRDGAAARVKDYFPDQYEAATGEPVALDESYVLRERAKQADERAFRAAHASDFVQQGYGERHSHVGEAHPNSWIPQGYALIRTKQETTGEERHYLVPESEAIIGGRWGQTIIVADENRHLDVTEVVEQAPATPNPYARVEGPKLTGDELGIDTSGLTPAARAKASAELGKRWRFRNDDGTTTVESLGEHMARVGVHGKHNYYQNGKASYVVEYGGSYVETLSKASYDALTGVPDTTTESQKVNSDYCRALDSAQRAEDKYRETLPGRSDRTRAQKARDTANAKAAEAKARRDEVHARESAAFKAWQTERLNLRQAALARIAEAKGISFEE